MGAQLIATGGHLAEAEAAARLIHASDPAYYDYCFGASDVALRCLAVSWRAEQGSLSHAEVAVWRAENELLALASHYPVARAVALQAADDALPLQDLVEVDLAAREATLSWLFPHIPADVWYLQTLAVAPQARSQGLGSRILHDIEQQARAAQASELHTDVDSANPGAARFYQRHGFVIVAETRVPALEPFNLPASYRMVKKLA